MSSTRAARRAFSAASREQQPLSLLAAGPDHSFSMIPVTSQPASFMSAAATDESTPPDMATTAFRLIDGLRLQKPGGPWGREEPAFPRGRQRERWSAGGPQRQGAPPARRRRPRRSSPARAAAGGNHGQAPGA